MLHERRKNRSTFKDEALRRWLASVSQREKLAPVVMTDAAGLLIASSASDTDSAEHAAKIAKRIQPGDRELIFVDAKGNQLVVRSFAWAGETLYVSTQGDLEHSRKCINEAIDGINRILLRP